VEGVDLANSCLDIQAELFHDMRQLRTTDSLAKLILEAGQLHEDFLAVVSSTAAAKWARDPWVVRRPRWLEAAHDNLPVLADTFVIEHGSRIQSTEALGVDCIMHGCRVTGVGSLKILSLVFPILLLPVQAEHL
jgi:hypothetical protein